MDLYLFTANLVFIMLDAFLLIIFLNMSYKTSTLLEFTFFSIYRAGFGVISDLPLGALGLVVNAIVVWNTRYIETALTLISEMGEQVEMSDVQRLSPLGH